MAGNSVQCCLVHADGSVFRGSGDSVFFLRDVGEGEDNATLEALRSRIAASLYSSLLASTDLSDSLKVPRFENLSLLVVVPDDYALESLRKKARRAVCWESLGSRTVDGPPEVLRLHAEQIYDFGVCLRSRDLAFYCRKEVRTMLQFLEVQVLNKGHYGWIHGPPGSGKSTTAAAFALALDHSEWVVTWIRFWWPLPPSCVRLEGSGRRVTSLGCVDQIIENLDRLLRQVNSTKKHIVLLDGVTSQHTSELMQCTFWLERDRIKRRLVVLSSMGGDFGITEYGKLNVKEFFLSSWRLGEYLEAVQHDEVFRNVEAKLDASNALCVAPADWERPSREAMVRSKFYFAGGDARFMFGFGTSEVLEYVRRAVDDMLSPMGCRQPELMRYLFSRVFEHGRVRFTEIVSQYAAVALAMYSGPSAIKNLADPLRDFAMNAEWMVEVCFFARLCKGGVTLYNACEDEELFWPEASHVLVAAAVGPQLSVLDAGAAWFKPPVSHQGGFDAVFIDKAQGLVRFVQVPSRVHHKQTLHIGYFYQFLRDLAHSKDTFPVKTLEIFALIERDALEEFAFASVTGEGLLASYAGGPTNCWAQGHDEGNVKRVGLECPPSWDAFAW